MFEHELKEGLKIAVFAGLFILAMASVVALVAPGA